jgi:hypothetical protein
MLNSGMLGDMVALLEYFGITREVFFPHAILGIILYVSLNHSLKKSINRLLDERLKEIWDAIHRIEIRLGNIENRLDGMEIRLNSLENQLNIITGCLIEIQTVIKMKWPEVRLRPISLKVHKSHPDKGSE